MADTNNLAPIPYDDKLLDLALHLKQSGLPWSPHVGCFVHDFTGFISVPSPFPNRIYFILSMQRFLRIFGNVEMMTQQLVWLPTWYQAIQLCQQLDINNAYADPAGSGKASFTPVDELMRLYELIARRLKASSMQSTGEYRMADIDNQKEWIRRVMESELGDVTHLPHEVQRRIEFIYQEVATAYLGWRRIQEHQNDEWFPDESKFDSRLLGELGHFYSDYQHPIKSLKLIRQAVILLRSIDPDKDPKRYHHLIMDLMNIDGKDNSAEQILEKLSEPI